MKLILKSIQTFSRNLGLKTIFNRSNLSTVFNSIESIKTLETGNPLATSETTTKLVEKTLKIAIIGSPNAGKSTLTNRLIGCKVAPVANKVHTTRCKTIGVFTQNDTQLIILDTPGLIENKKLKLHNLEKSLLVDPHLSLLEADIILVVVDVEPVWYRTSLHNEITKALCIHNKPSVLILNKVDLLKNKEELFRITRSLTGGIVDGRRDFKVKNKKHFEKIKTYNFDLENVNLPPLLYTEDGNADLMSTEGWNAYKNRLNTASKITTDYWCNFKRVFMLNSLTGDGVLDLREFLINCAVKNKWLYNKSTTTTQTPKEILKNCVFEALLNSNMPKEIPYSVKPKIKSVFQLENENLLRCDIEIICFNKRQLNWIIGTEGKYVKQLASEIKQNIMDCFKSDATLKLGIKLVDKKSN